MCRFIAYLGKPMTLQHFLFEPENSLVEQSFDAKERKEPLNGDGFGIGFYVPELDPDPARFVSTTPAWNNRNLRYLAPKIRSSCMFAHVRAASVGDVMETNCHPFHFGRLLFMHNGHIGGFRRVKRRLREQLADPIYDWIEGSTDSEHLFALVLQQLGTTNDDPSLTQLRAALLAAMAQIIDLCRSVGESSIQLNLAITNGLSLVATRFAHPEDSVPNTLYTAHGSTLRDSSLGQLIPQDSNLVVSEKLNHDSTWSLVPKNHMVTIDRGICSVESICLP